MPLATCWRIQLEGWIAGIDWASWEQGEIFKQTNQPPQAFNPNREEKLRKAKYFSVSAVSYSNKYDSTLWELYSFVQLKDYFQ